MVIFTIICNKVPADTSLPHGKEVYMTITVFKLYGKLQETMRSDD